MKPVHTRPRVHRKPQLAVESVGTPPTDSLVKRLAERLRPQPALHLVGNDDDDEPGRDLRAQLEGQVGRLD